MTCGHRCLWAGVTLVLGPENFKLFLSKLYLRRKVVCLHVHGVGQNVDAEKIIFLLKTCDELLKYCNEKCCSSANSFFKLFYITTPRHLQIKFLEEKSQTTCTEFEIHFAKKFDWYRTDSPF